MVKEAGEAGGAGEVNEKLIFVEPSYLKIISPPAPSSPQEPLLLKGFKLNERDIPVWDKTQYFINGGNVGTSGA